MLFIFLYISYLFGLIPVMKAGNELKEMKIFDFANDTSSLSNWIEMSDSVREVGMSKAIITMQKTQVFQRAVLFTLLNPQPNGAGFAGVKCEGHWDLSDFNNISLHLRAQGQTDSYKVVLRHRNQNKEPYPTYEQTFDVNLGKFVNVILPLSDFKPYYRGRKLNETEVGTLNKSFISSIGLQVYGGVYLPKKQAGVGSLEIDWIRAE